MSAGETGGRLAEPTFFIPDGTFGTIDRIVENPDTYPYCIYDGMAADVVFVTPEGTDTMLDVRVAPLCAQHIGKQSASPLIPIIDMTGGHWSRRFGFEPLLNRGNLTDYRAVLEKVLDKEDLDLLFPGETSPDEQLTTGWRRVFQSIFRANRF